MSALSHLAAALRDGHARFSTLVETIRPDLHRYCARMTKSVLA
jgi:DNA-directed RNA polymerase specialized sigma24 family protein